MSLVTFLAISGGILWTIIFCAIVYIICDDIRRKWVRKRRLRNWGLK